MTAIEAIQLAALGLLFLESLYQAGELKAMSAETDAIKATVADAVTEINAAVALLKANAATAASAAADNAALTQANTDLTNALSALKAELPTTATS